MQLTGGGAFFGPVAAAVDEEGARTTDAFAAVVVERHRFVTLAQQVFIQYVQHLQKRHVW